MFTTTGLTRITNQLAYASKLSWGMMQRSKSEQKRTVKIKSCHVHENHHRTSHLVDAGDSVWSTCARNAFVESTCRYKRLRAA